MKTQALVLALMVGAAGVSPAQMMDSQAEASAKTQKSSAPQSSGPSPSLGDGELPQPDAVQQKAASTFAAKPKAVAPKPVVPAKAALVPLTPRERVVQMLDRFTFGPRPGEVDRVMAMGADKWLEQQLNPDSIKDDVLNRRLGDYPTVNMSAQQVTTTFPDRPQVGAVNDGKVPFPEI